MPRLTFLLSFLALLTFGQAAVPFAHLESDLKPDPTATFGTLPNGLRYVIRPNHEPRNRASMRLVIDVGSLHETEDQRGLAHFLEHMAFNGSEHYPPGTLVEFFQRMGMNFGGDTNASTGFDRTIYMLELPDTRPETLAEGFRVFSDYAGGLLLRAEDIDKERGIIHSERRTRDSVGFRTLVARIGFLLQGSRFPDRLPIGDPKVIEQAPRERFVEFYNTWYRPERMAIVVVGEVDPAAVEQQIKATFAGLQPRGPARGNPPYGQLVLPSRTGVEVFHHPEPEAPETAVTIGTLEPYAFEPDNAANRVKYLPRSLATAIVNRRLSELAKKEGAPFTSGSTYVSEEYDYYRDTGITLTCRADQWDGALAVADQELRRALRHGFQPAELKEVVASFRNSLEQAEKRAATRRSENLAAEIVESIVDHNVFTTPADDRALFVPALERLTVDDCLQALREAWQAKHRFVIVTGNARIPGDARQAILEAYHRSAGQRVAPPATIADTPWGYTEFGAPGKVVHREHIPDLDVTLVRFANGVRLNLKRTDFEANVIRVTARIGTGQLTEPRDQPGLSAYLGQTFVAGGLGRHSSDDLRRILAGRTVGAGFSAAPDAFVSGGVTNREDLLLQLQLMTARIVDPGYRPEAARLARKAIEELYLSLAHTPSGPFTLEVARLIASGDTRFGLPAREVMLQRNLDEVKAWVSPELKEGYLEVALAGDLDIDATIEAVGRTFGALPPRRDKPALDERRVVKFPDAPIIRSYTVATEIPKGVVAIYWPTTDSLEISRSRRLNVLGEVLSDRLRVKVREELGDAYSPGAGNNASDVYPGYGFMQATVTIDPPRAQFLADEIAAVGGDLAARGVTSDELERAKKPILTQLRESARTNQYWLGSVLSRAQEKPQHLEWSRTRYADIESITTAELDALAKQYLGADRASRVIVVPEPKSAATATPPGPTPPTAPPTAPPAGK